MWHGVQRYGMNMGGVMCLDSREEDLIILYLGSHLILIPPCPYENDLVDCRNVITIAHANPYPRKVRINRKKDC